MTKVRLCTYIDEEVRDRFYRFIHGKYSGFHGAVSTEVQNALAHWMCEQGFAAHTNAHINPGIPRVQVKIEGIIEWLRGQGYTNQFSTPDWQKAAVNTVGGDARTVAKYLRLARQLGRIKFYAGNVWEIV